MKSHLLKFLLSNLSPPGNHRLVFEAETPAKATSNQWSNKIVKNNRCYKIKEKSLQEVKERPRGYNQRRLKALFFPRQHSN